MVVVSAKKQKRSEEDWRRTRHHPIQLVAAHWLTDWLVVWCVTLLKRDPSISLSILSLSPLCSSLCSLPGPCRSVFPPPSSRMNWGRRSSPTWLHPPTHTLSRIHQPNSLPMCCRGDFYRTDADGQKGGGGGSRARSRKIQKKESEIFSRSLPETKWISHERIESEDLK